MLINSVIADNATPAAVTLVKGGPDTVTLAGTNTYSGGTIVNQGILTFAGTGTLGTGTTLTINNGGTVTQVAAGTIAATTIAINGGGVLTYAGASNTISNGSITFNNTGGTATPTLAVGTLLNLTGTTTISANNDNFASTPTISGTALDLVIDPNPARKINVTGLSPDGLINSSVIQGTSTGG